jgi:hypothetical protein
VDHKAENAHHRRAALVELDSPLLQLPLIGLLRPAEVETVAEVPPEFRLAGDIGHDADLEEGEQRQDLEEAGGGDGVRPIDGGEAVGEASKGVALEVDVAGEVNARAGDEVTNERELGDAPMLELNVTEAVECLLVGAVEEAEGIVETEGGLGAELGFEGVERRGGLGHGGGGEGGGGGDGGGEDDGLHVCDVRGRKCGEVIIVEKKNCCKYVNSD